MRKAYILFVVFLLSVSNISLAEEDFGQETQEHVDFITSKAKVIEIISDTGQDDDQNFSTDLNYRTQIVKIKMLNEKYKDKEFTIEHTISGNFAYDIILEQDINVVVNIDESNVDEPIIFITDYVRDTYLLMLVALFIVLLLVIGGVKGLKSVVTLTITGFVIMYIMLPLILKGYNPLILTIASAMFIALMTFFIIGGINAKSVAALIGTAGGVIFAGVLAYISGSVINLTGLSSEEAGMLMHIPQDINFDFASLLFSGIIIGTLGAVMDVTMSISSSMYELRLLNQDLEYKSLVRSGLNIGKDIMGTMSNTLILAYTGSSIPLLLLFMAYDTPISKIFNLDLIATEIVRAIIGSIGLVIAIPITAFAAGLVFKSSQTKKDSID